MNINTSPTKRATTAITKNKSKHIQIKNNINTTHLNDNNKQKKEFLSETVNIPKSIKSSIGKGGFNSSLMIGKKLNPGRPKSAGAFKIHTPEPTKFRYFYERGDLPLRVNFSGAVRKIQWQVDLIQIDYNHYLPIFFEGLRELDDPYKFLAYYGTIDLIEKGGDRSLLCIPNLILPIKQNLMTKHPVILCTQMKILQKLVVYCKYAGESLVPYYRQFLVVFNLFITKRVNCGDSIDYGQAREENIGDLIYDTLYILEKYGGEDAFVNMKY